ncbi:MAG: flagellar hook assembly protein FlgD [Burkholderiales bacterium]
MIPALQAIGAGLSALSAIKTLTDSSAKTTSSQTAAVPTQTTSTAASGAPRTDGAEIQDRFLKLLVTQMKNQDPLNPLDNAQVTTQLAQISTVGGIDKLNTSITNLSSSLLAAQSAQSASLIGRNVYALGSTLALSGGKATGAFDLQGTADRVTVMISDSAGALVRRIELGQRAAGVSPFEWDGKTDAGIAAPAGNYVFQVSAARGNAAVTAEPMSIGRVSGVSLGNAMTLDLEGGGSVAVNNVKRIY